MKLRDVARDISYGFTASASDEADGPRMLRITDIQDNKVSWSTVPRCECDEPTKYLLTAGDIVIARTGATTGKSFLLRDVPEPSVFASYLIRVQPGDDVVPEYLANYMLSPTYWEQITVVSKGTAQPGANASILGALDIPLAPIGEQRRIVAKLEALQARSRRSRQALDAVPPLLEKLRQSILAAAFRGDLTKDWRAKNKDAEPATKLLERIRLERRKKWEESELAKMKAKGKPPTDDKWKTKYKEPATVDTTGLPELPEGWCWASLDELLAESLSNGRSVPTDDTGFPVLRLTALRHGGVDLAERKGGAWTASDAEPFLVKKNDFLVSRGNGSLSLVGRGGLVEQEPDGVAYPDTLIRVRTHRLLDRGYLARVWSARVVRRQVERAAKTTAGIFKVSQGDLEAIAVPVPSLAEQERIASRADSMLERVRKLEEALESQLALVTSLERAILAKAFRGQLVPLAPNDEPTKSLVGRANDEAASADRASEPPTPQRPGRARRVRLDADAG